MESALLPLVVLLLLCLPPLPLFAEHTKCV
jgi:hypothetical protein